MRSKRKKIGLTQDALGRALGIHKNQISRYERGAVFPQDEQRNKIANYLSIGSDDFSIRSEPILEVKEGVQGYQIKPSLEILLNNVKEIFASGNKDIVDALTANIGIFINAIRPVKDRRKSRRLNPCTAAHVKISNEPQGQLGTVINASHMGLLIQSTRDMVVGEKIEINICFSKDTVNDNFRAKGEVVWKNKQRSDGGEGWRYGVKFSDVLDGGHAKIASLFQE